MDSLRFLEGLREHGYRVSHNLVSDEFYVDSFGGAASLEVGQTRGEFGQRDAEPDAWREAEFTRSRINVRDHSVVPGSGARVWNQSRDGVSVPAAKLSRFATCIFRSLVIHPFQYEVTRQSGSWGANHPAR